MEIIDVVDSAVKIGLGALITAVAGYLTARANHDNERHKDARTHRFKTIELIADKTERFFHSYIHYLNHLQGIVNEEPGIETRLTSENISFLQQPDEELFKSVQDVLIAHSRLKLLGAEDASRALEHLNNRLAVMRNRVAAGVAPSKNALDEFSLAMRNDMDKFQKELAALYSANSGGIPR